MLNLQCLYHQHYRQETLLIPPSLSQLDTSKYADIHKPMLAHLVSGMQIICLESTGNVVQGRQLAWYHPAHVALQMSLLACISCGSCAVFLPNDSYYY